MQCMRCGRDVTEGQVFCEVCLAEMEKYPVRPGTAVLLPHYRRQSNLPKKPAKRTVQPEEQIRRLKRRSRILAWLLAIFITLAAGMGYLSAALYIEYGSKFLPGQNYSAKHTEPSETTSEPTGETTAFE